MPEKYLHPSWKLERNLSYEDPRHTVSVAIPAKFDLIGGISGTIPHFFTRPAAVLNAPLRLSKRDPDGAAPARDAIRVAVQPSQVFSASHNGNPVLDISRHHALSSVLRFLKLAHPRIAITIETDIPKKSFLGEESLLTAAILAGVVGSYEGPGAVASDLRGIVDDVMVIEQEGEGPNGWDHQIGAMFPGIKLTHTLPYEEYVYEIRYADAAHELSRRSLIVDPHVQHSFAPAGSWRAKQPRYDVAVLREASDSAERGFDLLEVGDIDLFARLMTRSWEAIARLQNTPVRPAISFIKDAAGAHLAGYKAAGVGDEGYIFLVAHDENAKNATAEKIQKALPHSQVFDVSLGGEGKSIVSEGFEYTVPPHERL